MDNQRKKLISRDQYMEDRIGYLFELLRKHQEILHQRDAMRKEIDQHKEFLEKYNVYQSVIHEATKQISANDPMNIVYGIIANIAMLLNWSTETTKINDADYVIGTCKLQDGDDHVIITYSKTVDDYNNYPFPRQSEISVMNIEIHEAE